MWEFFLVFGAGFASGVFTSAAIVLAVFRFALGSGRRRK